MIQKKNEIKLLILALLFLSGIVYIFYSAFITPLLPSVCNFLHPIGCPAQEQISLGDKILTPNTNPDKEAGVRAFAQGDFATAAIKFQSSLRKNQNAPDTLIYLNNALAENSNPLKIVVSVPISSNLNVALEILRGVAQAQDEVNRNGGINGRLLQVEIADDKNDPAIAKKLAADFVANPQILAVVGHNASDASVAACPVYQQGKLVMISPTSFSQNLSGCGNYIFRTTPSIRFVADRLALLALKTARKTNIAVCSDRLALDNQSFRDEFILAVHSNGGNFVNTACDFSAPDFDANAAISEAIDAGADSLLLAPHVDRINKAIKVALANKQQLALFGSPTLYTIETLEFGQADVNGLVLAVAWHPGAFPGHPFVKNATALWGGAVNWRTAMAYDAIQAIATGLQLDRTRDGLQKALSSPSFSAEGATGTIRFLPSGSRNGVATLVQVQPNKKPGSGSGTGYDFFPFSGSFHPSFVTLDRVK